MTREKSIPVFLFITIFLSILLIACSGEVPSPEPLPEETPAVETPEPAATPENEGAEDDLEETQTPGASGLTAVIVSGDSAGTGKPFTFDATQSLAGEAAIVNYVWSMGDGTTLFGIAVEHAYDEPGFYTVSLTVTDEDGQIDTVAKVVEIVELVDGASPTPASESAVEGTHWQMDNAIRGTSVTLIFDEDGLSGSAGCNSYNATYSATPVDDVTQDIVVDSITSSSQVCTLEVMGQETGYLESLASANSYTIDGNKLILETDSGTLTFSQISN